MSTATTAPERDVTTAVESSFGTGREMSHEEILEALSGLLLGLFVAILSSTVVSNALPTIIKDLHGTESSYTWVVTATLLATTVTTPVWGKLADLFSKKLLVQIALLIFVASSAVAGLSQSTAMLITCRTFQGIGAGGLTALAQVVMAAMIAPRERGRYSGYLGAVFALATVGGPLIGGVIVDTSWLGWRWCFIVGVPFAALALVVLQKTLHLPTVRRDVTIDYAGATLIAGGVSLILVWVSLAGHQFPWLGWQTWTMVVGGLVLLGFAVYVESRAAEPIIPLHLFHSSTVTLATIASLFVGVAMFGSTIFLSQYFQISRGVSPTRSGLMTLPLILGLFLASTIAGRLITQTGRWKGFLVGGGVLLAAGMGLMGTITADTSYWQLAVFMACLGVGLGMLMQNLVLAVQNTVALRDLGAGSSVVAFFRSLGGAVGVSALGAVLGHRVIDYTQEGLASLGIKGGTGGGAGMIPDMSLLPGPVQRVVEHAYGSATADIFVYATPAAVLALVAVLFIREVPLRGRATTQRSAVEAASETAAAEGVALIPESRVFDDEDAGRADGDEQTPAPRSSTGRHRVHPAAPSALPSDGCVVTGTVSTWTGDVLAGALVTLLDPAELTGPEAGVERGRAVTQPDGSYVVEADAQGSLLLVCSAEDHQPVAVSLLVNGPRIDRDLVMNPTTGVRGRVVDTAGDPVGDAVVEVTDATGYVVAATVTSAQGSYRLSDVSEGPCTVTVTADGYQAARRTIPVTTGTWTRADVEAQVAVELVGTVRAGSDGRPVREASVTLVDASGGVVAAAVTDATGQYRLSDVAPGPYTLLARGFDPVAAHLEIHDGETQSRDVVLGANGDVSRSARADGGDAGAILRH